MIERDVETALDDAVAAAGGITRKWVSPGRRGVPDRLVILEPNIVAGVECKATGERPTKQQLREHQRLRDHGMPVYVVAGPEDIEALMRELLG